MSDDIDIRHEEGETKGRYVAHLGDVAGEAELTYSKASDALIIADHTGVPKSMSGRGIGTALVAHAVADARARGVRIVPLCPFVKAQANKHPEWSDVIQS